MVSLDWNNPYLEELVVVHAAIFIAYRHVENIQSLLRGYLFVII